MSLPARPVDAPLANDFFSGGGRLTDGRLKDYLNGLEGQVNALVGGTVSMVVDDVLGSDASIDGAAARPLKTIVEAERRAALIQESEVDILIKPHGGAGYTAPTFRPRVHLGAPPIWARFTEFVVIVAAGDTGQGGSTAAILVTSGGLTPDALEGKTIEILDGAAAGDRRMIRNNDATDIMPVASFSADVTGAAYRVIGPDPGNLLIMASNVPLAQGTGIAESVPIGNFDFLPGLRIVNAIVKTVTTGTVFVVDGRVSFFGCELDASGSFVNYEGSGQVLFGRSAWNAVTPPAAEAALGAVDTSWMGWGVAFTGGHFPLWKGTVPYVSGYVTAVRWVAFGGEHEITGHIRGAIRCVGENNPIDTKRPRVTFGALAPFLTPRVGPGKISNTSATFIAVDVTTRGYIVLGDDTEIESTITDCIRCQAQSDMRFTKSVFLVGTNGANGVIVKQGGRLTVAAAGNLNVLGTLVGDELQVGNRAVVGTFATDLNVAGKFVSGARAFWDSALAVTAHTVTLSAPGAVVAVEATTATAAGVKQVQFSAAPAAGFVRVEYDVSGIATLTFHAADAVTVAAVLTKPEDDGSVAQAL